MTWALIPVQRYQHSIVIQVPLLRRTVYSVYMYLNLWLVHLALGGCSGREI